MPRARGRKVAESGPSGAGQERPRRTAVHALSAEQIRLILEEEEDSDIDTHDWSDEDGDSEEDQEVITDYAEVDSGHAAPPDPAAASSDGTPGGADSADPQTAAPDSDDSSDDDESHQHRPAAEFVMVAQNGGEAVSRTGRVWSKEPPNHRVRAHSANVMRDRPGPCGAAKDVTTLEDALALFLPDSLLLKILQQTNREGERLAAAKGRTHIQVDLVELRAFIGMLLLRGCEGDRRCDLDDLFYGPFSRPFYRATMTRDHFKYLLRILRFDNKDDRESRKKSDKFAAIREVFNDFNKLLQLHYKPSDCITVDETLRSFRGRCGFVVYMANKPDKYGLLFRDVADARTRYVLNMLPYAGKADEPDPALHVTGASSIVNHLVRPYCNSGRNVTADRFYSSVELCDELLTKGLTYVGTINSTRRHLPEEAKKTEGRQIHSTDFYWSENTMLVSYNKKKNKNVLVVSTQHKKPLVATDMGKKPEVMLFYNETKGGVDTIDQMIGTYTCRMATRRWPVAVFLLMLDVAALNSWVITSAAGLFGDTKHGARKLFLRELGLTLVKPLIQQRQPDQMTMKTRAAVETVLGVGPTPTVRPRQEPDTARARCALCVGEKQGVGYKKGRHTNVNKVKQRCVKCTRPVCRKHSQTTGVVCATCAAGRPQPAECE